MSPVRPMTPDTAPVTFPSAVSRARMRSSKDVATAEPVMPTFAETATTASFRSACCRPWDGVLFASMLFDVGLVELSSAAGNCMGAGGVYRSLCSERPARLHPLGAGHSPVRLLHLGLVLPPLERLLRGS